MSHSARQRWPGVLLVILYYIIISILLLSSSNDELEEKKQRSRGVNNNCQRKCPCCAGVFMLYALVRPRAHGGGGLPVEDVKYTRQ